MTRIALALIALTLATNAQAYTCEDVDAWLTSGFSAGVIRAKLTLMAGNEDALACLDSATGAQEGEEAAAAILAAVEMPTTAPFVQERTAPEPPAFRPQPDAWDRARNRRVGGNVLIGMGAAGTVMSGAAAMAVAVVNTGELVTHATECAVTIGLSCTQPSHTPQTGPLVLAAVSGAVITTGIGLKISAGPRKEGGQVAVSGRF